MAAPSAPSAPDRPDAFISYSRRDEAFVETCIAPAMEGRGKNLWIDVDDIRGGASDWRATVWAGIEAARVVVFVLSPDSLASQVCGEELAHAEALNKRVIPVLRRPVDDLPVPDALARPNWILARDEDDLDGAIAALITAVETDEAWLSLHARLTQRTAEWLRTDRDASYLMRGSDLHAAERWLEEQAEHAQSPTAEQVAYIAAGGKAAARRQRMLLGGVLVALGISIALGLVANNERRSAKAQARAAQAIDAASRDPETALKLAIEAAELRSSPLVSRALRDAVAAAGWTRILRAGPAGAVNDVDLSLDGTHAATASENGTAGVWDVRTGRHLATLRHARGAVNSVQFSPDGRRVVTGGRDGTARLWDRDGRARRTLAPGRGSVWSALFDRDGDRVITGTGRGDAQVWDLARRTPPRRLPGGADDYRSLTPFSPDGRHALTAGAGGSVRAWSLSRPARRPLVLRPRAADQAVTTMAFGPDGRRVAAGYSAGAVCLWRLDRSRRPGRCSAPQTNTITAAEFSRDGAHLVTASTDGSAVVRSTASGRALATLRHTGPVNGASFDAGGRRVLTAGADRVARIWALDGAEQRRLSGHTDAVVEARFSRDGRSVLTGSDDGGAGVWTPGADIVTLPGPPLRSADVSVSPDSRLLLAVDRAGAAVVWDRRRGRRTPLRGAMRSSEADAPCGRYAGCGPWSPDSARVAGVDARGRPTIWDARSGAARRLGPRGATGAAFAPGGRRLAVLNAAGVRLVDPATGAVVATLPAPADAAVTSVGFTADGGRVLTVADDGTVRPWDAARGTPAGPATRVGVAGAAALSPDGATLAVGADSGRLRVSGVRGDRGRTLQQHVAPISTVAFDRAGRRLAVASEDHTASVWRLNRLRQPQAVLRGHTEPLLGAELSGDGRFVLTAALGEAARLWDPALETTVLELRKGRLGAARFSPDGRWIALGAAQTVELHRCLVCAPPGELLRAARARVAQR